MGGLSEAFTGAVTTKERQNLSFSIIEGCDFNGRDGSFVLEGMCFYDGKGKGYFIPFLSRLQGWQSRPPRILQNETQQNGEVKRFGDRTSTASHFVLRSLAYRQAELQQKDGGFEIAYMQGFSTRMEKGRDEGFRVPSELPIVKLVNMWEV